MSGLLYSARPEQSGLLADWRSRAAQIAARLKEMQTGVTYDMPIETVGGPVDLITAGINALGVKGAGLLPVPEIRNPVGGSAWIKEKLQPVSGVAPNEELNYRSAGAILGGLGGPLMAKKASEAAFAAEQFAKHHPGMLPTRSAPQFSVNQDGVFNVNGLPNGGRDFLRDKAESLADAVKKDGFIATVRHTGSSAGPSSYVEISDPQTMRYIKDPIRFSGHSKGPKENALVWDMSSDDDIQAVINKTKEMRAKGLPGWVKNKGSK